MYLGYLGETNPCEAAQGAAYSICKEAEVNPALKSTCDSLWAQAQHCEANAAAQRAPAATSAGSSSFWDSVTAFMPVIQPAAQMGLQLGLQKANLQPSQVMYTPPRQSGGSNTLIVVGGVALVGLVIYLALK